MGPREGRLHPRGSYRADGDLYVPVDNGYIPEEGYEREEQVTEQLQSPEDREEERVKAIRQTIHGIYKEERHTISRINAMPPDEVNPTSSAPTRPHQEYRIETVRDIVRLPHLISRDTIVEVLNASNWDVNDAAARLRRRDRIARNIDPLAPLFPGLPRYEERPRGVNLHRGYGGTSVQTSRRAVMAALLVRLGFQPGASLPHSNTTIIAFLHAHFWDLEEALEAYRIHDGNLDAYQRRGERLRSRNPTQYQQDQRLAEFLSWVSIDNLHSARQHLIRFDWDVARAADEWVRLGYVPILRPNIARTGTTVWSSKTAGMRLVSVEYGPDNDNIYVHEDAGPVEEGYDFDAQTDKPDPNCSWATTTTEQPSARNPPDYSNERKRKRDPVRRRGWFIDENRVPPRVNCPNPIKLRDEVIERGEYQCVLHRPGLDTRGRQTQLMRWIDSDEEEEPNPHRDRPEFDWRKTTGHVKRLTQDRNQFTLRMTQENVRELTTKYHPLELQWLWDATSREVERYAETHSLSEVGFARGLPPPIPRVIEMAWEADFNQWFYRQTMVDGVSMGTTPRPWRTGRSLHIQATRTAQIVEDFLLTRNLPNERVGLRRSPRTTRIPRTEDDDSTDDSIDDSTGARTSDDDYDEPSSDEWEGKREPSD